MLTQGWRRQLRRMFAAVGAPVERLVRVRIGSVRLEDLAPGGVRALSAAERDRLAVAGAAGAPRRPGRDEEGGSGVPGGRRRITVSLDGPASSGKSSVGAAAAAALGYRFCDTGVLYRGLAWLAHDRHVAPGDARGLLGLVERMRLAPDEAGRLSRVLVDGRDVTARLHSPAVDRLVSAVAADPEVRTALLPVQREVARGGGIVMAGRDIGSVVLPDAELRLYLEVSAAARAARRARQRGVDPASDEGRAILDDLVRRDRVDSGRAAAPLRVPDGATLVCGDGLDFDATVALVVSHVRATERRVRGAGRRTTARTSAGATP